MNTIPATITGTPSMCSGFTTTLADAVGGGVWSSSNTSVVTVGSTGIVTSVAASGTATITYSLGGLCFTSTTVTVNPVPLPITGVMRVCAGLVTHLSDATTGGTWSSSNPSLGSVGLTTGNVTGGAVLFNTTVIITYTAPGGCFTTTVVTVNALPNPIAGTPTACAGTSTVLTDPGGGTWSSSNTLIATVGSSTGVVWGVSLAGGTATITYTLPTGCDTTTTITISAVPDPITGVLTMCEGGGTTTLFDGSPGGYWQSNNIAIASIDPFLGTVTGGMPGVDTITYTTSCTVSVTVTVNAAPPPITGPGSVCTGSSIILSDAITGGTWTSSNTALASIGLTTGVMTGGIVPGPATSGFVTITYTAPSGCSVTTFITVYPPPGAIAGTLRVCAGQSTSLTDPPGGGTWMSTNTSIAVVTPGPSGGGITTGVLPGLDTIIYTQPGTSCTRMAVVTVNSAPGPITGSPNVCISSCITLTDATSGGTWTSSNVSVATAGATTGMICGLVAGTSTITYSLGGSCVVTIVVTVRALPAAISGTPSMCVGASTTLTDGTGTWTSGNTAVATIGVASSGTVYGASPGTSVITFTATTGCSRTIVVTVNAAPAPFSVTGGGSYCSGGTGVHIGLDGSATGITYKLYNGASLVATSSGTGSSLDFGLFTVGGTYTVSATSSCSSAMPGSAVITISPLPPLCTVNGGGTICPGGTGMPVGLGCSSIGISYQLLLGGVPVGSPVAGTGLAISFGPQTVAGTYTVVATNTLTGCSRAMTGSVTISVSAVPSITGPTAVCASATITETAPGFTGGTWSSSNTAAATVVPSTGLVTGVTSALTTTITYTTSGGCTATTVVTVSSSPGPITGPATVCVGASVLESDTPPGGSWISSNTAIATVISTGSSAGTVTGVTPGPVTITYSLGSGCTVTRVVTVTPSPGAILGPTNLCAGATSVLTDAATGGTWISSNTGVATVSGGSVGGVNPGTATITYTLGGCTASIVVTVNSAPGAILGLSSVCTGSMITLTDGVTGGTWTSSSTSVATVDGSGNVWGALGGSVSSTTTITYSLGGTCVATKVITVNPISGITGSTGLCVGSNTTLSAAPGSGIWFASGGGSIATITAGGLVTGIGPGTSTITYTTTAGCIATTIVTVNTAPSTIGGTLSVCVGSTTSLSDLAGGGTWTSGNTSIATVAGAGSTSTVYGVSANTVTIVYSLGFGCTTSAVVTVNAIPAAIGGTLHACSGSTSTLTDATTGGTWSSSNIGIASFSPSTSGIITGGTPGTATVTYRAATGCFITAVFTTNSPPAGISGSSSVCVGSCTLLGDATTGGSWSSSSTAVATVNATGQVCGVSPGFAAITYSLGAGCTATKLITVLPPPPAIAGPPMVCVGATVTLLDAATGGTWSTGSSSLATINSLTGTLGGVSSGTVIVSYTIGSGCSVLGTIIVNALSPVTGSHLLCQGMTMTLTDTTGGGSWISSNTAIATATTTGVTTGLIGGVAPGTATITYLLPTGCEASFTITVNPAPPAISGTLSICAGSTTSLGGGGSSWTSSNTSVATVSSAGVVTGVSYGTATIISMSAGTGCPATAVVTVNPVPPPIGGPSSVCLVPGTTITLTDALTGGIWSVTPTSIATIDPLTGVLSGVSGGTATAVYAIGSGCTASTLISVNTPPPAITGPSAVCAGAMITLADAASGGTWSSSNTDIATVDASGNVTGGTTAGTATIIYATASGCAALKVITVYPQPGAILGATSLCQGIPSVLTDATTGGTWSSDNTLVAAIGSTTGIVTTPGTGSAVITYTAPTGCTVTTLVIVNTSPDPISGSGYICLGGSTTLTETSIGGVWSSSNTSVATVDGSGNVFGLAPGTSEISYSSGVCAAVLVVTVSPIPDPISGIAMVCTGSTTVLSDLPGGGTWSSADAAIATINEFTGEVLGVTPIGGTVDITYSLGVGCTADIEVTVNPVPAGISGPSPLGVCETQSVTLFDATTGGVWSSSSTGIATISPSGILHGIVAGTTIISYTLPTGCAAAAVATVHAQPTTITGPSNICLNSTQTLSDAITGGTWTSANTFIATVGSTTGVVRGMAVGATTIVYSLGFGCTTSKIVLVQPLPTVYVLTGGGSYCAGGAGVHIGLNNSSVGVNYLLYHGSTPTGTFAGTGAALDFGLQTVAGSYTVVAISTSTGCTNIMGGSATVTVLPTTAPTVSINTPAGDTVCSGTSTMFTAIPFYGGSGATFAWQVNGVAVGTGSTYTFIPANGDEVSVTLTSDSLCALPATASSNLRMTVWDMQLPVAGITATPGDTVCRGMAVTVTAAPVYGGTSPTYEWIKNGASASTGAAYTYIPADGDILQLSMNSNYLCRTTTNVLSTPLTMSVDTPYVPVVTISGETSVAIGKFDTLTATVASGDAHVSYQWVVNNLPVAGATTNTFISNNFTYPREDSVTCIVTTDGACGTTSFGWVYISLHPEGVSTLSAGEDFTVVPNPNRGSFVLKGTLGGSDEEIAVEVTDMLGQVVYRQQVKAQSGKVNERIQLSNIANGMYLLNLKTAGGSRVFHIVVEQ